MILFIYFLKYSLLIKLIIFKFKETEMEIEDEVDILMSSDIMAAQMSTKSITFTRAQSGWIFREDRKVNLFTLATYNFNFIYFNLFG